MSSVESLARQLRALQILVALLEEDARFRKHSPAQSSSGPWSLAEEPLTESSAASVASSAAHRGSIGPAPASSRGPVDVTDRAGCETLARDLGAFIRRALAGEHTQGSGRDRLNLKSRVYLVFAGFDRVHLSRPKVFLQFNQVSAICKRGSSFGSSVFIGVPSQWEARVVIESAGFEWSSRNEQ